MSTHTLFIADVHLQLENDHPINSAFIKFLSQEAPKAEAIYILGDLFEMWVGDDVGIPQYKSVIERFKQLTDGGIPIYLLFGNRDFLMGKRFWKATGIQPIKQLEERSIHGVDVLVMHGDTLCTDDREYQKMRKILRHPIVTWLFLRLPQKKRLQIGHNMREKSRKYSQNKPENIMDVNAQAVQTLFTEYPHVNHLIHGHTHRPAHHVVEVNGKEKHRWVLGDWRPETKIIKLSGENGIELLDYPSAL
ncbi:UDP-2,3-diacylglucosamine diphosphatase [Thiomicrorhabdus sp. ZW0627]|uniref:UDP-2,3-diacylglucosamine diphosphatase n=1 Tax=Thiomicrorhabdus sp. ZW0627 TaxID=3039774 RepID=UPI00243651DE|nr:UDP-2,3-diacylglucosamine diphosphatase [Thiomicrorhabdus sp. ZW0627]MDG6772796.1 UDP-2,3-diacylglucosamine diphosphatase [Thiomicrorhabdus sp. ZW0627]